MSARSVIARLCQNESVNFVFSNRIPRRLATRVAGWLSTIEQPLVRDMCLAVWRFFSDLDLSEAKKTHFTSLRDCFIRELKDGARPINRNPKVLISPCDGIVGGCGRIMNGDLLQVKGSTYPLQELLGDCVLAKSYHDGCYVTLRLTAGMYHRFHAPHDCRIESVTHIWGDTWNVNPAALVRIDRVFCRNERVVICARVASANRLVTLVPIAAILVAGIRLRFIDLILNPRQSTHVPANRTFRKGEEIGWFEHGSTMLVLAPPGVSLCEEVKTGRALRMGEPLLWLE